MNQHQPRAPPGLHPLTNITTNQPTKGTYVATHPYRAALDRRAMKRNAKLTTAPQANQVKPVTTNPTNGAKVPFLESKKS